MTVKLCRIIYKISREGDCNESRVACSYIRKNFMIEPRKIARIKLEYIAFYCHIFGERRLSIHVFFMTVFSLNSTKKIYFIIFQLFLYDKVKKQKKYSCK